MAAAQASSSFDQDRSAAGPAVCTHCGTTTEDPGLTWMREFDPRRGSVWCCTGCARSNLRAIEAKLDRDYW